MSDSAASTIRSMQTIKPIRAKNNLLEVVAHGELLIDFVSTKPGVGLEEATFFAKSAGGAPANVAVGLARLGVKTAFMGKVGDDEFGRFLASTLRRNGVDIGTLRFERRAKTALAFVALQADGEREFAFYRSSSADMLFAQHEVDVELLRRARIFHFGSVSLASEPSRSAALHAASLARQNGLMVSFDPNLRLNLWPGESAARSGIEQGWREAHLVKLSADELTFLTGETDVERGVRKVPVTDLLVVTLGERGCFYVAGDERGYTRGFPVHCRDTTGAGDGFMAGLLAGLLGRVGCRDIFAALRLANAVGALVTTKRGALPAMPSLRQVSRLLR